MVKIEQNTIDSSVNQVEFFLYTNTGIQLDTSYCKDVKINIKKPIVNINFDIETANYLNDLGINAFDPTDSFFNDICYSFTNENGTDVILKDRKMDYFQNETFCEDNCNNFTIDYETMYINCECTPESLSKNLDDILNNENPSLNFGNIKKAFTSNLFKTNLVIVKCYKYILKWNHMNKNYGNWILLGFILIEIIAFLIFLRKKLRPIKNYLYLQYYEKGMDKNNDKNQYKETEDNNMIKNSNSNSGNPPIRNKNNKIIHTKQKSSKINLNYVIEEIERSFSSSRNNTKTKDNNNNNKYNNNNNNNYEGNSLLENISIYNNYDEIEVKNNNKNDMFIIKKSNSRLPTIIPSRNSFKTEIFSKNENTSINISKNKNLRESITIYKNPSNTIRKSDLFNEKEIDPKFIFLKLKKNNHDSNNKLMKIKEEEPIIKKKRTKKYLTSNDYMDLDYEEALELDKRNFLNIVWGYILEEQIICNTFLSELFLELRIVKIYFMIFSFCLELFLNAIFFTDDYISEMYHNDGVLDFFTSLPKSVYSLLVGFIIMFFLNFLSNSKNAFDEATDNIFDCEEYKKKVNKILFGLKIKLAFFFTINFLLMIFFWYYCSTFCAVYYNSQEELVKGTLVSIITSMLIPFPVSIIMALIRYIALKKKSKCLFRINYCIDKII